MEGIRRGIELDLVTHDVQKFFTLLLRRNGYVLEPQWKLFPKESPPRAKRLLYVYRVLLTGIHLMRTGIVEANLVTLNDGEFRLPYIDELVQRKVSRAEQTTLDTPEIEFHRGEYLRLVEVLESAGLESKLPETPTARQGLHDLLVRIRRGEASPDIRLPAC
jgi:predicted nucleotidyltransferase